MIFTIRATSETISTCPEISGRVARLFNETVGFGDILDVRALCGLLRPCHCLHLIFSGPRPQAQSSGKAGHVAWNNIGDVLLYRILVVTQAANIFGGKHGTKIVSDLLFIKVCSRGNRATAKKYQSNQYQSHINPLQISPNKARLPRFGNGEGMIMVQHSAPLVNLPLFIAPEQAEINRLQSERETLQRRINLMRPHSHKRVELEARLRTVTARQLAISAQIERPQ